MAPPRALSEEDQSEVLRRYVEEGLTATALAREYGVNISTICRYLRLAGVSRDLRRRDGKPTKRAAVICTQCGEAPPKRHGKCAPCLASYMREYHIKRTYGISAKEYDKLLERQGGVCAICRTPPDGDDEARPFHVDHDHSHCPGRRGCPECVRGILCPRCNWRLPFLDAYLEVATQYLLAPPSGVAGRS